MNSKCLNCEESRINQIVFYELGWHTTCPVCEGTFDVDIDEDYLVSLWQYDFNGSIDDLPEHHEFIEQFAFRKTKTMKECKALLHKLKKFEGMTYELYVVESGDRIALGVFSEDSLYDDLWYEDDKATCKQIKVRLSSTNGDELYPDDYVLTIHSEASATDIESFIESFKKDNEDCFAKDVAKAIAEQFDGNIECVTFSPDVSVTM